MTERFLGRAKDIVGSFARRIGFSQPEGTSAIPTETQGENADTQRMWQFLNIIPITELNSLTPGEVAKLKARSLKSYEAQIEFQNSLNLTVEEFFAEKPSRE